MNLKQIKLGKTEEQTILHYLLVFEENCIYFKICHLKYISVDHNLFIYCCIFRFDFSTFSAIKPAVILTSTHIVNNLSRFFIFTKYFFFSLKLFTHKLFPCSNTECEIVCVLFQ